MHQKTQIPFDEVVRLVNEPLVKGQTWYLLDKNWYDSCKSYNESECQTQHPGPIDNSALFQASPTKKFDVTNDKITAAADSSTVTNGDCEMMEIDGAEAISVDSRPLKADLRENVDFICVPETCWTLLKDAYGLVNVNHAIKRKVIELVQGFTVVEISLVKLKLCLYGGKESTVEKCFSKTTTLDELQQEMRKIFNISSDREAKLWIDSQVFTFKANGLSPSKSDNSLSPIKAPPTPPPLPSYTNGSHPTTNGSSPNVVTRQASSTMNSKPIALPDSSTSSSSPPTTRSSLLSNSTSDSPIGASSKSDSSANQTFIEAGISENAVVTLEIINSDGTWPSSRPRYGTVSTRSSKAQPGLCGLSNMGNTCFMNAALQCLSNTPPLTNYILTDEYIDDINTTNPLGMHGEIARTYAELIKVMWSGNHTSFLPREFKCAVSRFAPQFIGFSQQDSQELMAFLLDGLHEDLNRIKKKPYIEIKNDIETRPDEVVAEESWSNYKKRNDSIVVDTFHAMLKSTLVCPSCDLVSVTFDPFCYLSLPLIKQEKTTSLASTGDSDKANIKSSDGESSATSSSESNESSVAKVNAKPTLQLKDCITQFTSVERLGAYDPWFCPRCKKHQQATKKFDIWSLPEVLIIHLKRFSFSRSWRDKIDTLVEFPVENLDMSEYVLNPSQKKQKMLYNLIGVSNHFGGLGGGHYTAYAKNVVQDAWYSFDDALVSKTSSNNVVTRSAYVLFYQLQKD